MQNCKTQDFIFQTKTKYVSLIQNDVTLNWYYISLIQQQDKNQNGHFESIIF